MKMEDNRCMNATIHHSGLCMSMPVFLKSKRNFNSVKLNLPEKCFYLPQPASKICLLCPSDMKWDVRCLLLQVWWMSHDQSAYVVYVITAVAHMSSENLQGADAVFFFRFLPDLLFLIPTNPYSSIFFLFSLQPFVIHDMKSLMEGEQFINCRQMPIQEHQQQTSALTVEHGG